MNTFTDSSRPAVIVGRRWPAIAMVAVSATTMLTACGGSSSGPATPSTMSAQAFCKSGYEDLISKAVNEDPNQASKDLRALANQARAAAATASAPTMKDALTALAGDLDTIADFKAGDAPPPAIKKVQQFTTDRAALDTACAG